MPFKNNTCVIGISGVTCGGKTTLANDIVTALSGNANMISQDDYFLEVDDPRHTWIDELKHINFDILSSLDMVKLEKDACQIQWENHRRENENNTEKRIATSIELSQEATQHNGVVIDAAAHTCNLARLLKGKLSQLKVKILVLEGFCIFNYAPIDDMCDIKFYFTLDKDECKKRREKRVYDPPDCVGYFELCAWPEHLKQLEEVANLRDIQYLTNECTDPLREVLLRLYNKLS